MPWLETEIERHSLPSEISTDTVPFGSENLIALSSRLIHTCFSSSSFAHIICSPNCISIYRFLGVHFSASSRTAPRICSERLNLVTSVRIVWFSTRVKFNTLFAMAESRSDSSSMTSRYSSFCSSVRFPRRKSFAKPAIETIGVLNS